MSLPYGPPYPVSPLIRGIRFALLLAGIVYGRIKQAKYEDLEETWREEEAKRKVVRDRELAKLKEKIAKEEREVVRQIETGELFRPGNIITRLL
ncbi:unnamed protein product [Parnassius apollo]|uniref:ATP synthase F(0) complex subunit e, mitochondrial n=1 Tax=Parnassius apollo TaxID=110799 RepID=A0A8S3XDE0_PARAO|nr:unnamed protein product [Parnassius apollo]